MTAIESSPTCAFKALKAGVTKAAAVACMRNEYGFQFDMGDPSVGITYGTLSWPAPGSMGIAPVSGVDPITATTDLSDAPLRKPATACSPELAMSHGTIPI